MSGIYGAFAVVLVISVIAVAFASGSPEIGVAEFAPAARNQLDAPPTTGGEQSGGSGARGRRTTTTTAPAGSATTDPSGEASSPTSIASRGRSCAPGTPPRQIDDPMSPVCQATIFEGDNGGATSNGVTSTEIKVAVPLLSGYETSYTPAVVALFEYMNRHFEFYGRRLVPVITSGSPYDPVASRAMAAEIISKQVFANLPSDIEWNVSLGEGYVQELARHEIVTVGHGRGKWWSDRQIFDNLHPYVWSVYQSAEEVHGNLVDFVCKSLAGQKAVYASDRSLQGETRKFGILVHGANKPLPSRDLVNGLTACGETPAVAEVVQNRDGSTGLQNALNRLKGEGATSLLCICEGFWGSINPVYGTLSSVKWGPEWILTPSDVYNDEYYWQSTITASGPKPFGLADQRKLTPYQALPWFAAFLETAPQLAADPNDSNFRFNWSSLAQVLYTPLLVLASGIQGAGPNLNPDSFAHALLASPFPNPGAGQAPFWQPRVGFGPGDHTFFDDYALAWWSSGATPVDPRTSAGNGSWCYVDRGARQKVGEYGPSSGNRFFAVDQPCR